MFVKHLQPALLTWLAEAGREQSRAVLPQSHTSTFDFTENYTRSKLHPFAHNQASPIVFHISSPSDHKDILSGDDGGWQFASAFLNGNSRMVQQGCRHTCLKDRSIGWHSIKVAYKPPIIFLRNYLSSYFQELFLVCWFFFWCVFGFVCLFFSRFLLLSCYFSTNVVLNNFTGKNVFENSILSKPFNRRK